MMSSGAIQYGVPTCNTISTHQHRANANNSQRSCAPPDRRSIARRSRNLPPAERAVLSSRVKRLRTEAKGNLDGAIAVNEDIVAFDVSVDAAAVV
jgi:hypothetical protein